MRQIIKLAVIRDNQDVPCPFGLNITRACLVAGNSVDEMQVVENVNKNNIKEILINNYKILKNNPEQSRCKYAAHLFNNPNVVDCDFGDTAAGLSQNVSFVGSPYYNQIGEGLGMAGLLTDSFPDQEDIPFRRNLYYGIQEWSARRQFKSILRQALLQSLRKA